MSYKKLEVFQKAYKISLEIHKVTLSFPVLERIEIGDQLRRSSKSIAINIAEGIGKQESRSEAKRYMRISLGSCEEVRVWLEYCKDLGCIKRDDYERYDREYIEIGKMLMGLIKRYSDEKEKALKAW